MTSNDFLYFFHLDFASFWAQVDFCSIFPQKKAFVLRVFFKTAESQRRSSIVLKAGKWHGPLDLDSGTDIGILVGKKRGGRLNLSGFAVRANNNNNNNNNNHNHLCDAYIYMFFT